jgi:hypothetical protein
MTAARESSPSFHGQRVSAYASERRRGESDDDDDDDEPATMAHLCTSYLFLRSAIAQAVTASNTFMEEAYIVTCPGTRSPALSRRDPC